MLIFIFFKGGIRSLRNKSRVERQNFPKPYLQVGKLLFWINSIVETSERKVVVLEEAYIDV